jgi:2-amino-4-hydroxy-6-hydroxymethyldihydropteridine diphosphokinase
MSGRLAYLSLGSNIGNRAEHLRAGVEVVAGEDAYRTSRVYESEPVGGVAQDDFWNMVIELDTTASPRELLERARAAEDARGRTRDVRWGPRTLDVDVLLVGDETSADPEVLVPHPRMYERAFVLYPLAELAPALVDERLVHALTQRVVVLDTLESLR